MICWRKTGSFGPRGQWAGVAQHKAGSAFTWSVLPVIAAKTEPIGLATGVTCPFVRYHPAIIARAAATMALVSDGRLTPGVGAGECLNEHVVSLGFPGARHERFREALEIIWRAVSRRVAGELGDGLFATEPDGDLVSSSPRRASITWSP